MSEGRGEGSGLVEIGVKGRCFREAVQVFEGGWMSRDVPFVRRFQFGDLYHTCGKSGHASVSMAERTYHF